MDGAKLCVKTPIIVNDKEYERWIEMMSVYRYTDIKEDIAEELENLRDEGKSLENVRNINISNSQKLISKIRNCQREFPQPRKKKYSHFCLKFMN